MLSKYQIERVLKQAYKTRDQYEAMGMCGDEGENYFNYMRTEGWINALELVLNTDVESINKNDLNKESQENEKISTR